MWKGAYMANLRIGFYPINSKTAEHTYAKMEAWGSEYRFHCYGGVNDADNQYPVNYYRDRNAFYTRDSSRTNEMEQGCHPFIAMHLIAWGGDISTSRYDYNRKSGGVLLGDSAGILYAVTGVCHQMCNTITCATNINNPFDTLINWPPSLNMSKLIYGNRGNMGHVEAVDSFVAALRKHYKGANEDELMMENLDTSTLNSTLDDINRNMFGAIKDVLDNGVSKMERRTSLDEMLNGDSIEEFDQLVEADYETLTIKNELDNALIHGTISNQEYADKVNAEIKNLAHKYYDILKEEKFEELFETSLDNLECNIIDFDMMPTSYSDIKDALGF